MKYSFIEFVHCTHSFALKRTYAGRERRWEDNTKMNVKNVRFTGLIWLGMMSSGGRAVVNAMVHLHDFIKDDEILDNTCYC
jgi:hypothetical protein